MEFSHARATASSLASNNFKPRCVYGSVFRREISKMVTQLKLIMLYQCNPHQQHKLL